MRKRNKKFLHLAIIAIFLFFSFGNIVSAYPGSGQGNWEEAEIEILDPVEGIAELAETGKLVNPMMDNPENYEGEQATFGSSCLTCHGGDEGAQSPEQPYHGAITVDFIRTADEKSMMQEDGSLLIEVDPNGGVTNYKLVVGLSEDVYDGGHEDDRALAGWHFALPQGIKMDLPYCMHIIGPGLSKVYPDNNNAVFSDIKVAAYDNFEEGKGVLQILSGTQNATPNDNKTYGTLIVEYKYSEDVPVEEGLTAADFPGPETPGMQLVYPNDIQGESEEDEQTLSMGVGTDNGDSSSVIYYILIGIILLVIIFIFMRRKSSVGSGE